MFRNDFAQQLKIEDEPHSPWQTNLHHSYQVRNVYHPRWLSENSNPPPHREVVEDVVVTHTNWGPFKFHQMLENSSLGKPSLRELVFTKKIFMISIGSKSFSILSQLSPTSAMKYMNTSST